MNTVEDVNEATGEVTTRKVVTAELMPLPAAHQSVSVPSLNPKLVVARAGEAARALMDAMATKTDKVMMGGKRYIEVDDWQVVARFYDCSLTIVGDRFVKFDGAKGFEATAALLDRDGREVGRATMMCLDDEEKWSTRPKYEIQYCLKDTGPEDDCAKHQHAIEADAKGRMVWIPNPKKQGGKMPKKLRVAAGTESIPLFQLRSMAQTRAAGKICRLNFGFVPALANYASTPAEELDHVDRDEDDEAPAKSDAGQAQMTQEQAARVAEIEARQRANRERLAGGGEATKAEPKADTTPKADAKPETAKVDAQAAATSDPQPAKATAAPVDQEASQAKPGPRGVVKPQQETPAADPAPAAVDDGALPRIVDLRVQSKGTSPKGPWSLYVLKFNRKITAQDGQGVDSATTLDEAIAHAADEARTTERPVKIVIVPGSRKGSYNVVQIGDVKAADAGK